MEEHGDVQKDTSKNKDYGYKYHIVNIQKFQAMTAARKEVNV